MQPSVQRDMGIAEDGVVFYGKPLPALSAAALVVPRVVIGKVRASKVLGAWSAPLVGRRPADGADGWFALIPPFFNVFPCGFLIGKTHPKVHRTYNFFRYISMHKIYPDGSLSITLGTGGLPLMQ